MPEKNEPSRIFDIDDLRSVDEDTFEIIGRGGVPTGWIWTMAGPGHPKALEQSRRMSHERIRRERQHEAAQVNGKKFKPEEMTPDEELDRNIRIVIERMVGWSVVSIGGEPLPFNEENARKVLRNQSLKPSPLVQALEFLGDDAAFTRRSAIA